MVKNETLADTWFKLASLTAILTGAFFILASMNAGQYLGVRYDLNSVMEPCRKVVDDPFSNKKNLSFYQCVGLLAYGLEMDVQEGEKRTNWFLFLGFLMMINSFLIWGIGRRKLRNKEFNDFGIFILLVACNLAVAFLFWFLYFDLLSREISRAIIIENRAFNLI